MRLHLLGLRLEITRAKPPGSVHRLPAAADFSELPVWDYALRRIHRLDGRDVESFLRERGQEPSRFDRLTIAAEAYRTERSQVELVYAGLAELARVAMAHGCEYVVDPAALGHSGFSSRSTSGFGVGLAGLGFGFASPDGTFSQAMHLVATGLVRRPDAP